MPEYRIWCPPSLFEEFNQAFDLEPPEVQARLSASVDAFQELLGSPEIRVDADPPIPPPAAVEAQITIDHVRFAIRVDFAEFRFATAKIPNYSPTSAAPGFGPPIGLCMEAPSSRNLRDSSHRLPSANWTSRCLALSRNIVMADKS